MLRFPLLVFFVAMLLAEVPEARAQLSITTVQPARLARAVPRSSPVSVSYSQPLGAGSAQALQVFSNQRGGRLPGTATVNGNTLTFQPSRDFRPGETLWATATTAAQSASGTPLAQPQVWQFTAAAVGGTGQLVGSIDVMGPSSPYAIAVADLDNDGDLDLVSANSLGFNVTIFRNDGMASFTPGGTLGVPVSYSPQSLAVGDIDNDGDLDLVAGAYTSPGAVSGVGMLCIRTNNGNGVFLGSSNNLSVAQPVHCVVLGDVDGDGDLDLLAGLGGTGNAVQVRLNNGLGTFGSPSTLPLIAVPVRLRLGDLDGDGALDLVASTHNGNEVSIRFNNGRGTFSGTSSIVTGFYNRGLDLTDFDLDGDLDVVLCTDDYQGISLHANNGRGGFSLYARLPTIGGPSSVAAADLNGDGAPDIMGASSDRVETFLNNGMGGFGPRLTSSYISFGPRDLTAGDLDGDGDLDVALASTSGNRLSVRLNGSTGPTLALGAPAAPAAALALSPVPAHQPDGDVWVSHLPATTPSLVVRDAMGRVVRTVRVPAGATAVPLSLSGLAPGLYTVQAGSATGKLVIE